MEGFLLYQFLEHVPEAMAQLAQWQNQGRLLFHEEVVSGLENAVSAFSRLFSGGHRGKLIIKI